MNRRLDKIAEGVLYLPLLVGPLLLGSVEGWSESALWCGVWLATLVAALAGGAGAVCDGSPLVLMALGLSLLAVAQGCWAAEAGPAIRASACRWLALAAAAWTAERICRRPEGRVRLARTMCLAGGAVAFMGIAGIDAYDFRPELLRQYHVFGPYLNKNHAGGMLALVAPLALAAVIQASAAQGRHASFGERADALAKTLIAGVPAALILAGLWVSRSKGAMLAVATASVLIWAMFMARRRGRAWLLVASLGLAAALAVCAVSPWRTAWIKDWQSRAMIYRASIRMFTDAPLLGFGFGSYQFHSPRYQESGFPGRVLFAHNDWLQLLIEGGAVAAAWVAPLVALFGWKTVRSLRAEASTPRGEGRLLSLAGAAGLLGFGLHGLIDFNLQIPANALLAFALSSLVWTGRDGPATASGSGSGTRAAMVLIAAASILVHANNLITEAHYWRGRRAELPAARLRFFAQALERQPAHLGALRGSRDAYLDAAEREPQDRLESLRSALRCSERALRQAGHDPVLWRVHSRILAQLGRGGDAAEASARAFALAPWWRAG